LKSVSATAQKVYEVIVRRFLCIFYPPAQYQKINLTLRCDRECFFTSFKLLVNPGFLEIATASFVRKKTDTSGSNGTKEEGEQETFDQGLIDVMKTLKKGSTLSFAQTMIKEGETSPPKRYTSGSLILAMENAGQLIEDEELRSQIKGSGIGTSATRAEILSKLVKIKYLQLNKKTQVITPQFLGEMVYDVVDSSIRSLLNPELTASWEKGLTYMAQGEITEKEYMQKLENYISKWVNGVKTLNNQGYLRKKFDETAVYYKKTNLSNRKKEGKQNV
jgi:DNA topoisomerase-3